MKRPVVASNISILPEIVREQAKALTAEIAFAPLKNFPTIRTQHSANSAFWRRGLFSVG
ncbi:MAG: hypothetical protein ACR2L2_13230 [Acidobacteriota bacterium]